MPTPRRLRPSMKSDAIHPRDFRQHKIPWACEDCTHFDSEQKSCTIGYDPRPTMREEQHQQYFRTGRMILCRFHEID